MAPFKALFLSNEPHFKAEILQTSLEVNPNPDEVVIRVEWSGVNYKDGLAVTNQGKIIRGSFPFVPGIDLAGVVVTSKSADFEPGDRVLSTGWGLGESNWGGYAQYQQLPAHHLVRVPDMLSNREAMIIGTAGFTAMLGVIEIEHGPRGKDGIIVVTGATGGVGSFSVLALTEAGYEVAAVTGKASSHEYLKRLGASSILDRSDLSGGAKSFLDSAKWSGCIDSVGSTTLEAIISQTARHGTIAACGLAAGPKLDTSVFPFILRGVRLIGIDSNTCPNSVREVAWQRLGLLARTFDLNNIAHEIPLESVPEACQKLMSSSVTGRYVVNLA